MSEGKEKGENIGIGEHTKGSERFGRVRGSGRENCDCLGWSRTIFEFFHIYCKDGHRLDWVGARGEGVKRLLATCVLPTKLEQRDQVNSTDGGNEAALA